MFEVQKGVPLPAINRAPKRPKRKYPIDTMEIGDMFFVPDRSSKSMSAYLSRIAKGLPGRFSARHAWMKPVQYRDGQPLKWVKCEPTDPGAREGVGVWRVS